MAQSSLELTRYGDFLHHSRAALTTRPRRLSTLVMVCIYPAYRSIRVLESTVEELKADNRLLRAELSKIVSEVRDVKTTIQNPEEEVKNNQSKTESAEEYLTTVNEILKTEISMVRSKVHDAETELHTVKEDVKDFQHKVDKLKNKNQLRPRSA